MVRGFGDSSRRPDAGGRLSAAQRFLAVIGNSACRPVKTQLLRRGCFFFSSLGRRSQSPPHACSHMLVLPSRVPLSGWCLERNSAVNQSEYAKVGKGLLHPRIIFLCRPYLRKDGVPPPPGKPTQQPPSHAYTLREIPNYAGNCST